MNYLDSDYSMTEHTPHLVLRYSKNRHSRDKETKKVKQRES